MRIGIIGASGRVGTRLIEAILASPGLELAAALVSPGSPLIGKPVAGALEYRPAEKTIRSHCDVMIDFSTPAASLAFQDLLGDQRLPVVIGTTGFTVADDAALTAHASARPLLVSANFAHGFEAFKQTALGFASKMPGAEPQVIETYYARKKADPSGTSKMLASEIAAVRSLAMGFAARNADCRQPRGRHGRHQRSPLQSRLCRSGLPFHRSHARGLCRGRHRSRAMACGKRPGNRPLQPGRQPDTIKDLENG